MSRPALPSWAASTRQPAFDFSTTDASTVHEGERKTVTALFADIKVSMELLEDLDREEVRAFAPALTLVMPAVHRYDRARGPPPFFPEWYSITCDGQAITGPKPADKRRER